MPRKAIKIVQEEVVDSTPPQEGAYRLVWKDGWGKVTDTSYFEGKQLNDLRVARSAATKLYNKGALSVEIWKKDQLLERLKRDARSTKANRVRISKER